MPKAEIKEKQKTEMVEGVKCIMLNPVGSNNITGYPKVICPNCKRHFYWRKQDKVFHCVCGENLAVNKNK